MICHCIGMGGSSGVQSARAGTPKDWHSSKLESANWICKKYKHILEHKKHNKKLHKNTQTLYSACRNYTRGVTCSEEWILSLSGCAPGGAIFSQHLHTLEALAPGGGFFLSAQVQRGGARIMTSRIYGDHGAHGAQGGGPTPRPHPGPTALRPPASQPPSSPTAPCLAFEHFSSMCWALCPIPRIARVNPGPGRLPLDSGRGNGPGPSCPFRWSNFLVQRWTS